MSLRLTFGCSNLGSDLSPKASRALVEGAYECGFRQFDVAPSYGNGLAESLLGDALRPVREHVSIITKTGIAHPKAASSLRAVRKVFLPIKKALPGLWKAAAGQAKRGVEARGRFGRADVLASVAESLRRLGTDHVEALLLHEVLPDDLSDELLATLAELQAEGRVHGVGLGTTVESAISIVAAAPRPFNVVQVNHHWGAFVPALTAGSFQLNTHRWLKSGQKVVAEPAFRARLPREVVMLLADEKQMPALLLAAALAQNPRGQLLVSSSKLERLKAFVEATRSGEATALAAALNARFATVAMPTQAPD